MIQFKNATNRKTPCYYLDVGRVGMVISYETIVAACYKDERIRRINDWGPTTKRHMEETNTDKFDALNERDFEARLKSMVLRSIADSVEDRLAA